MDTAVVRQKYDAFAPSYDVTVGTLDVLGMRRLRRAMLRKARGRVLEVGFGTGRNLLSYPAGCEVMGADLSWEMLKRARRKIAQRQLTWRCAQMDTHVLAFADNTFDTVVDALCLCTYMDPVCALAEMARVCRADGRILLLEHGRSRHGWLGRLQDRLAASHAKAVGCIWNREPDECCEAAGLRLVAARRTFFGMFHVLEALPVGGR